MKTKKKWMSWVLAESAEIANNLPTKSQAQFYRHGNLSKSASAQEIKAA